MAHNQRFVHRDISSDSVFEEEGDIRRKVKKLFQQCDFHWRNGRRHVNFGTICPRFHASTRFWCRKVVIAEVMLLFNEATKEI